jgi:5-methylcytosine-specific restriction enzyme A
MRLPKRSCSTPGCGKLTDKGPRCVSCQRKNSRQQDARRASPWKRGYNDDHNRLRVLCFQRDGWRCVDCGWEPDIVRDARVYELDDPSTDDVLAALRSAYRRGGQHLHGDHDTPIEQRPDLRLDLDNYRTRCNRCHSAKTMRETQGNQSTA